MEIFSVKDINIGLNINFVCYLCNTATKDTNTLFEYHIRCTLWKE